MQEKANKLLEIGGLAVVSALWMIGPGVQAQGIVPSTPKVVERPAPVPEPVPDSVPVFEYGPKGLVAVPKAELSLQEQGMDPSEEATVVVRLRHLSPKTVLDALRSVFPSGQRGQSFGPDFRAGEVPGVPKVLLTGQVSEVDHALHIIRATDVHDPEDESERLVQIYELEHADVNSVSQILSSLLRSQGGSRSPMSGSGPTQFVVDHRTRKLIVQAPSPKDLEAVSLLIKELDVPVETPKLQTRVIPLRHIKAQQAASIIEGLLNLSSGSSSQSGRTIRPGPVRSASSGTSHLLVQEEPNSLLVRVSEEQLEAIEEILRLIDVPPEKREEPSADRRASSPTPPLEVPAVPMQTREALPRIKARGIEKKPEDSR